MLVPIFPVLASLTSVLSQEFVSVTTSLITITPAPSTTPIAVSQAFIGSSFEPALGAYTSWFCPQGQIWTQDGNYARCCDNNPYVECGIATACLNTSLMVGPNSQQIWTCSGTASQTLCVTGTVYPSIGATQGVITNAQCWPSWDGGNWNATRNIATTSSSNSIPSVLAVTTKSVTSTISTSRQTSTPSPSTTLTVSTSRQQSTPSPSTSVLSPSSSLPIGAIIGIVVGVVILAAIIILLCIYKRRPHKEPSQKTQTGATDPELQGALNILTPEPTGPSGVTELPVEPAIQPQMSPINVQYQNEAAHQSEVSVSGGTTGSIEEGGVLIFNGRAGRSSDS